MNDRKMVDRVPRLVSHALVDVKLNRLNPFSAYSAILLDLSSSGCKIEFTGQLRLKTETILWLKIPLAPFKIPQPTSLRVKCLVKWFDTDRMRAGGVFEKLQAEQVQIMESMLNYLALQERSVGDSLPQGEKGTE